MWLSVAALSFLVCCHDPFDFTPPSVTIIAPQDSAVTFDSIAVIAKATDNRRVREIQILIDSRLDTAALADSISCVRYLPDSGTHIIQARAADCHGNWGTSGLVRVASLAWQDSTPAIPERPYGPSEVMRGWRKTYSAVSGDPAGKELRYVFDWGDGGFDTTGLYPGGTWASAQHGWLHTGIFEVRALAINSSGRRSRNWSDTLTVEVISWVMPYEISWWHETPDGDAFFSSPAINVIPGGDTLIYVGCDDGQVYAFNARNGGHKGTVASLRGDEFSSAPVISSDGQRVYVADDGGWLYTMSATNLCPYSHYPRNDTWQSGMEPFSATPAVLGNSVYIGRDDGYFYWFEDINCSLSLRARVNTGAEVNSSAAISRDGSRIVVGNDSGLVSCFDDTLGLVWSVLLNGSVQSSPAIDGNIVYVGADDSKLHALNLADGSDAHPPFPVDDFVTSSPVIDAGGTVYFATDQGTVYAVRSGVEVWHKALPYGEEVSATGCLAPDTTLVINTDDGTAYGIDVSPTAQEPGRVLWRIEWPEPEAGRAGPKSGNLCSSPTVGPANGCFYAGSPNGGFGAVLVDKPSFRNGSLPDAPWPKFHCDIGNSGRQH